MSALLRNSGPGEGDVTPPGRGSQELGRCLERGGIVMVECGGGGLDNWNCPRLSLLDLQCMHIYKRTYTYCSLMHYQK